MKGGWEGGKGAGGQMVGREKGGCLRDRGGWVHVVSEVWCLLFVFLFLFLGYCDGGSDLCWAVAVLPFKGYRPPPSIAEKVARCAGKAVLHLGRRGHAFVVCSPPYDVLSSSEARSMAGDNEKCFLRVNKVLSLCVLRLRSVLWCNTGGSRRLIFQREPTSTALKFTVKD